MNGCWLWPCGPTEIYCLVFTHELLNLLLYVCFSSLSSIFPCVCSAECDVSMLLTLQSSQSSQRRDFSLTQRPFAVTLSGITEEKSSHWASIRLQHDSKTSHRARRSGILCVSVWVFGWWRFEQKGKAKGKFLGPFPLEKCVLVLLLFLDSVRLQSPPPSGLQNNPLQCYKKLKLCTPEVPMTA